MLLTRVVTAVVAFVVLVGMVFLASSALWAAFMLVVALVCCWEWSRMCGLAPGARAAFLAASAFFGAALGLHYLTAGAQDFARLARAAFVIAAVFWIVVAPWWLRVHLRPPPPVAALAGWIVIWPTWMAFLELRTAGPWVLLAAAALVWVADICAYFAGKRFGRNKLAPAVSPGKTWEGVYGALAGVAVYAVVVALLARHEVLPVGPALRGAAGVPMVAAMLLLAGLSIVGDLFESWMKRGAGLKDSSRLLPGHGGVLDRIDALTSTLPIAALALSLRTLAA